ncbi:hypothetical protein F2Q69_00032053 [Brassica cretica]|uniref:Uncharacterized protein n=1 Tax=Brassica cretica TaxID=69181 RepID=A0A8S9SAE5_BRACR|nr:hypothetical protein F2Q69_00032053 [Brassica cretica]
MVRSRLSKLSYLIHKDSSGRERVQRLYEAEMREQNGDGTGGPWLTHRRRRGLNPAEETAEPIG